MKRECEDCKHENKSIAEDPCYSCEVASRDNWEPKGVPIKVDQNAKHDEGKPRLSLVSPRLIEAVGAIRTYGTEKYNNDPDGWKCVSKERYKDALMRHLVKFLKDEKAVDVESGYLDLWHIACNVAFLIEMEGEE